MAKSLQVVLSPGRFQRSFDAPVARSKPRRAVCRCTGLLFGTDVSWQVHSVLLAASASMPKKNVPGPSALASMNFSAVVEPARTLYTYGELALPTITTPPGAIVMLSGCDFSSPIRISAADAALAHPTATTAQVTYPANRRALEIFIDQSPSGLVAAYSTALAVNAHWQLRTD